MIFYSSGAKCKQSKNLALAMWQPCLQRDGHDGERLGVVAGYGVIDAAIATVVAVVHEMQFSVITEKMVEVCKLSHSWLLRCTQLKGVD